MGTTLTDSGRRISGKRRLISPASDLMASAPLPDANKRGRLSSSNTALYEYVGAFQRDIEGRDLNY